jgi:SAM-dependent methyltransferase
MKRERLIEGVLCAHPGVRDAVVVRDASSALFAFVIADDDYMDSVLGRRAEGASVVGKWRKASDLSQLAKEASSAPVGFNRLGWDSSYTRKPIPDEVMHEWVEETVAEILRLGAKSVYEIGCGTGMLLTRIAPSCDRYVGVDFAPVVLARLKEQLGTMPALAERVEVMERVADDFSGIEKESFDAVVMNSVLQYFPNVAFLTEVLEDAVKIVRPGGHVFVGDTRSLPLLPAFASSVELFQAADEMGVAELRNRVNRRLAREQELVISPSYFLQSQQGLSRISRVEICPLRGYADSEMTRYRFHAILHVGHGRESLPEIEFLDWTERNWSLDDIRSMLQRRRGESIGIKRIQNARLEKDLMTLAILRNAGLTCTAGELRSKAEQEAQSGIHPQSLFDLESEELGFTVSLSWAACRSDGSYDACFLSTRSQGKLASATIRWPQPEASEIVCFANAPGQRIIRGELIRQLGAHCAERLPAETGLLDIELVDTLPRNVAGEVDASALLAHRTASHLF